MEIHDFDGILIVTADPLGKGGPGSGRYPAGSSGNRSRSKGKGKGNGKSTGGKALMTALSDVDAKLTAAEDANYEDRNKVALKNLEDAHAKLETQYERLNTEDIIDDDDYEACGRELDIASDQISSARYSINMNGNETNGGGATARAIQSARKAAEILEGYNP